MKIVFFVTDCKIFNFQTYVICLLKRGCRNPNKECRKTVAENIVEHLLYICFHSYYHVVV